MKMDSPYFFYNREHIEDSQQENYMEIGRIARFVIVDENYMVGPELQEQIEQFREAIKNGRIIVLDSCSMLEDQTFSRLEQRIAGFGRGMSKTSLLAQAMLAMLPSPCEWDIPEDHGDWRDFIQNPARPGRQIKKQKPPKHSFKAQMRSVNRNR